MERIPASERTLEQLKALTCLREAEAASLRRRQVDGRTETTEARSELVRLAPRRGGASATANGRGGSRRRRAKSPTARRRSPTAASRFTRGSATSRPCSPRGTAAAL